MLNQRGGRSLCGTIQVKEEDASSLPISDKKKRKVKEIPVLNM